MLEEMKNVTAEDLEPIAENVKNLASLDEVAADCLGGMTLKSALQTRFPVVERLLRTPMSQQMRRMTENGFVGFHKETIDEVSKWVLEVPNSVWSEEPVDTSGECCWVPPEFNKCGEAVPLNLLCIKQCENIEDVLMDKVARFGRNETIPGVANAGETLATAKRRWLRYAMAFFTARNILLGVDNTYTATLKPFHGVLSLIENPAVSHIDGTNILAAFETLGCRLAIIGEGNQWFACNPVIYDAIEAAVYPDENGRYPDGWRMVNGRLQYKGREFVLDKAMPVDTQAGTGEIWMLDDDTVGGWMATDLAPTDDFRRVSGKDYGDVSGACGSECEYLYNMGTTFAKDANKIAVITDVPVKAACTDAIADLAGLVAPTTLIPRA